MAQSPLVLLGGATATLLKGRGALQDIDQLSLMEPHVKWAATVSSACATSRRRSSAPSTRSRSRRAGAGVRRVPGRPALRRGDGARSGTTQGRAAAGARAWRGLRALPRAPPAAAVRGARAPAAGRARADRRRSRRRASAVRTAARLPRAGRAAGAGGRQPGAARAGEAGRAGARARARSACRSTWPAWRAACSAASHDCSSATSAARR